MDNKFFIKAGLICIISSTVENVKLEVEGKQGEEDPEDELFEEVLLLLFDKGDSVVKLLIFNHKFIFIFFYNKNAILYILF